MIIFVFEILLKEAVNDCNPDEVIEPCRDREKWPSSFSRNKTLDCIYLGSFCGWQSF